MPIIHITPIFRIVSPIITCKSNSSDPIVSFYEQSTYSESGHPWNIDLYLYGCEMWDRSRSTPKTLAQFTIRNIRSEELFAFQKRESHCDKHQRMSRTFNFNIFLVNMIQMENAAQCSDFNWVCQNQCWRPWDCCQRGVRVVIYTIKVSIEAQLPVIDLSVNRAESGKGAVFVRFPTKLPHLTWDWEPQFNCIVLL